MELWKPTKESETGLALSVKPLEHGRMKFKIYAEYRGEAWMQVARKNRQQHSRCFISRTLRERLGGISRLAGAGQGDAWGAEGQGGVGWECVLKMPKFCPYCGAELR